MPSPAPDSSNCPYNVEHHSAAFENAGFWIRRLYILGGAPLSTAHNREPSIVLCPCRFNPLVADAARSVISETYLLGAFERRTPGPPPFSSMNSTPALSSAWRRASFASVTGISPSTTSTRRIVATPTFEALARSRALHRSKGQTCDTERASATERDASPSRARRRDRHSVAHRSAPLPSE